MTRVLVTGGAGTLGAAVVRRLLGDPDYEVRVSDQRSAPGVDARGLRGPPRRPARAERGAQGVLGLHARDPPRGDRRGPRQPAHAHRGQQRARECGPARRAGRGRGALRLRLLEHGLRARATAFPTPEDHIWECPPPRSAYGFSKLTGEAYCRAAAAEHGLRYTICRPFNAYGPGGTDDAVIPDLIRKSLAGMTPLPIYGSGEQTRTFTHLDDVADGIVCAMAPPGRGGRGVQHRLARGDLDRRARADLLGGVRARRCGARAARPRPRPRRSIPTRRFASVEKARELLGWEAKVGVEEGVAQTVEWLRDTEVAA